MSEDEGKSRETRPARLGPPDPREVSEPDARPLVTLLDVAYLGGYVPVTTIFAGQRYDVSFLEDRLLIVARRRAAVLAVLPYSEVEDVDIGGPGLVRTGGGFVGGGFGVTGAIEGMAVASVLNGLTSRTSIKTVVRIQGTNCELFLLHTRVTPDQLRMQLSHPLAVIRTTRVAGPGAVQYGAPTRSASPVEELAKLADMLEKGLLTREEFDLMKAKLLDR
jgi:Short C-terminal domain